MIKNIILRLPQSVLVLFGLSLLIFFIARVIPGDPARVALGPLASKEQVQNLRQKMHLDDPIPVQYWIWLTAVVQGDFGESLYTRRPVAKDLVQYLPATFELIIFSFLMSLVIGQISGVLSGYMKNSWFDNISRVVSYIGVATPVFVVAILGIFVFSYLSRLFPVAGRLPITTEVPPQITGFLILDSLMAGQFATAFEALKHIFLPAASLALAHIAQESRITRASIIENLQEDYIFAHMVYGIPTSVVLFKYVLKPSLIPTVTVMGLDFAVLTCTAFLVETVFMWPGFSRYGVTAMLNKDLNAIVAVVLVIGTTFVVVNLIVDIVVCFLDPRIQI